MGSDCCGLLEPVRRHWRPRAVGGGCGPTIVMGCGGDGGYGPTMTGQCEQRGK